MPHYPLFLLVCVSVCTYVSVCVCICVCTCVYVCVSVSVYLCVCECVSACMYVCVSACIYACVSYCFSNSKGSAENLSTRPLQDVLRDHLTHYINVENEDARQNIIVRRQAVWEDTLFSMKKSLDFSHGLQVTFVGEEAVDEGGPLREYLRLLMHDIASNNALFCGPEDYRTVAHNTLALHKEEYLCVGKCIALSILCNGPGPHFISEATTSYLLNIPVDASHEDIPDRDIRDKIMKVHMLYAFMFLSSNIDAKICRLRTVNQRTP